MQTRFNAFRDSLSHTTICGLSQLVHKKSYSNNAALSQTPHTHAHTQTNLQTQYGRGGGGHRQTFTIVHNDVNIPACLMQGILRQTLAGQQSCCVLRVFMGKNCRTA